MIKKKRVYKADKKVNPFIGVLLFLISIVLLAVTGPLGFLYGFFRSLFRKGFKGIGEYLLKIAISVDQLGNVMMQHLLNTLWVKKGRYNFGNRDETISSALGRNKKLGTLTGFGNWIDKLLDVIDPNHSLNSIDYYIEPSDQIIDKLAWIHIVDGRILMTRTEGRGNYNIPGGKREPGEGDAKALFREIKEKLGVDIEISSLYFIGIFEAQADGHKPGVLVQKTSYAASYKGELQPAMEIAEMVWLNYKDRHMVSEVDMLIFDFLREKRQLE
ncbi:ADP-ribose pyrophosphatase YjhB, NUDIX family [Pricia antarctica]|uniref:ADP-ribose pyrophosphatase YjhB, NUDIX family n=1 Tax=Pricia antarctica TaxID=641691 RepID=A0A1G7DNJ9_9FLAO|nr:NUDIX domain-containing protein [Pricia antarctica]SDE53072.1 ADP-ribose pyrophosphatase YjhB, NUDIX family [Pricia antarctica]